MRALMATAFAILIGIAGTGFAGGGQHSFEDIDKNADGQISQTEAQTVEGLDFDEADSNQDGQLSRSEYQASDAGQQGGAGGATGGMGGGGMGGGGAGDVGDPGNM